MEEEINVKFKCALLRSDETGKSSFLLSLFENKFLEKIGAQ